MTREVHEIPPAPRHVRWRAVLWHWWPLTFVGFLLAVYGGLLTLMLFLAEGGWPSDDRRLDRECVQTTGTVTKVTPLHGRPPRIHYDFQIELRNGSRFPHSGKSFLPGGENLEVGSPIPIEHAPRAHQINRAVGGRHIPK